MTISKRKMSIEEKIAEIEERLYDTENVEMRTYYRGMLAAFQYALELRMFPYELEETIEV